MLRTSLRAGPGWPSPPRAVLLFLPCRSEPRPAAGYRLTLEQGQHDLRVGNLIDGHIEDILVEHDQIRALTGGDRAGDLVEPVHLGDVDRVAGDRFLKTYSFVGQQ